MAIESGGSRGSSEDSKQLLFRTISVAKVSAEVTKNGRDYWKISDDQNRGYSTWHKHIAEACSDAQDAGQTIDICVEVSKSGKWTNYTVTEAGPLAASVYESWKAEQQTQRPAASSNAGNEFNRQTNPKDAKRMTALALLKLATQSAIASVPDKPEGASVEQFLKAKVPEFCGFFAAVLRGNEQVEEVSKPEPKPQPKSEEPPPPDDAGWQEDKDIPF